jgi:glycosyltransferase involved in cell wall biosynthesis
MVVPAHNEAELLPSCLASLRRAEAALCATPVHLVVVADACRDQTARMARRAGAVVVTIGARRVGAARAAGVREVLRRTSHLDPASVWLANTDADTIVPPGWLARQVRYADTGWDAVAGTIRVDDWSGYPAATRSLFRERYGDWDGGTVDATGVAGAVGAAGEHPHVHGANLGCRAAAYLAAGGFGDLATAEDHALVAALTATGSRVLHASDLAVVTSARRPGRAPDGFSGYLARLDAGY